MVQNIVKKMPNLSFKCGKHKYFHILIKEKSKFSQPQTKTV
jgi:hypothetical protein